MQETENGLIGRRVVSLKPDLDHDENDNERPIPIGSSGTIARLNHVDSRGQAHYDVSWDNAAWTVYSRSEIDGDLKLS